MTDPQKFEATNQWDGGESAVDRIVADDNAPERVGRYRIDSLLGKGGFGRVYLADDEQLNRRVAVKVPYEAAPGVKIDAQAYLEEAQTVANLDHPNIVPVYDIGQTDEVAFFIVSKYIEGSSLAEEMKRNRLSYEKAADLIATIGDALHYAHRRSLVHRDVKPGNILLDRAGTPFLVDFGLALRERDIGKKTKFAGTPAYMSPEQARGEGHRVDGRSDIFSLGVVFYELLVGRRPFYSKQQRELLEQVSTYEPRPPRQYDDAIPKELERICLKALAKRASERYTTAKDMADDIRFFAEQSVNATLASPSKTVLESTTSTLDSTSPSTLQNSDSSASSTTPPSSNNPSSVPLRIVPKGLRSFDAHDADFFLELLPGPRDRHGLPDSVRFWKTRIEENAAEDTFTVGLIYGPSGCGKSSFVKAALLPQLAEHVIPIYVEASTTETEARLLKALRRYCPALTNDMELTESLATLRRGQGVPVGKKVVIVLDQFEQWLHAHTQVEATELVSAIRQCDGGRTQCIVMVRDDFWMAATRFVRELEVRLVEGKNSAAVDLFPLNHARKVLMAFGQASGDLPAAASDITAEHRDFVDRAVNDLSHDNKVICVRLALFAEMMKGRLWSATTLKEIGGTSGIGVTFLDETFTTSSAPPEHRLHQRAARAVLNALLPETGTDIKGHLLSHDELLASSGYEQGSRDFEDLIRILDGELRLITPTDPEAADVGTDSVTNRDASKKYYQLTHDYLIRSLREWLTRKQKETRRGRAELTLADRCGTWHDRQESRFLPSLFEYLSIRVLTDGKSWTERQASIMRSAGHYYGVRTVLSAVIAAAIVGAGVFGWSGVQQQKRNLRAEGLVQALVESDISRVAGILDEAEFYRPHFTTTLRERIDTTEHDSPERLRLALGLLPHDPQQVKYLERRLVTGTPAEFVVLRDALQPHGDTLGASLWELLNDSTAPGAERFRAACALAFYAPDDNRWGDAAEFVADQLTVAMPSQVSTWQKALWPVRKQLLAPLSTIYRDANAGEQRRAFATDSLTQYAADDSDFLFELLADANHLQFAAVFEATRAKKQEVINRCVIELNRPMPAGLNDFEQTAFAKRQANSAVALVRLDSPELAWSILRTSLQPTARSQFIHAAPTLGVPIDVIIDRLAEERDPGVRAALILTLGEFNESQIAASLRAQIAPTIVESFRQRQDAAVRHAAEWLLRRWGITSELEEITSALRDRREPAESIDHGGCYVNAEGIAMVVLDAGEFVMGSPDFETGRGGDEPLHRLRIGRRIAVASTPVTRSQYQRFQQANFAKISRPNGDGFSYEPDSPILGPNWYDGACCCNWLSQQDGIEQDQWCYLPSEAGGYSEGMRAADGYRSKRGYRLLTEPEWEYACRAGTTTAFSFGADESLLEHYAWYQPNADNHAWPCGMMKPNDFGLFDMHGNCWEWVHEQHYSYAVSEDGTAVGEYDDTAVVIDKGVRLARGGTFQTLAHEARSASRNGTQPSHRIATFGFRVVRTIK